MDEATRILMVEDMPADAELAEREIIKTLKTCVFQRVDTREEYLAALEAFEPDLIVSDYSMPRFDGLTALKLALERTPFTPLIILTGSMNEDTAVECMKAGASNYVIKEQIKRLGQSVLHALEEKQVRLERVRAERAVRESEERFRSVYENAPIGIYRIAPDGRILLANPAALRMLGFDSIEEVTQLNMPRGGNLATQSSIELHDRIVRDGAVFGLERTRTRKDGSTLYVRENVKAIRDEQGRVLHYDGTFEDITDRKQAEQALRESETRYRMRTEELQALVTLSIRLREARTSEDMFQAVLREMRMALAVDTGVVSLLDEDGEHLTVVQADGINVPGVGQRFGKNAGVSGEVLRSGEPFISEDLGTDSRWSTHPGHGGLVGPAAFVPLRSESEFLGVLMATRNRDAKAKRFSPEEVRLLIAMGEMVGNAVRRARLFDDVQRHLRRTLALHDIQRAIAGSLNLQLTLSVVLEYALAQLGVDAGAVLLLNPHTLILEYVAGRGFRTGGIERRRLRIGEGFAGRAALERRTVSVPDLSQEKGEPAHLPLIASEEFVAYYGVALIAKGQVKGVLEVFHRSPLHADADWLSFLETLAREVAIAIDNLALYTDLQQSNLQLALAYDATISGLSRALDLRDKETEGHTQRVVDLTVQLAQAMGINDAELVHVRRGALLHDMGKMGIPDSILLKPDKLTEEEWRIMRCHPQYALDMFSPIEYLRPALVIPYAHHEKWDGTGYPRGLKGEEIPLAARLFAIVDVWDALIHERPYRPAWPRDMALDYIRDQAGKHFDPRVVRAFLSILNEQEE